LIVQESNRKRGLLEDVFSSFSLKPLGEVKIVQENLFAKAISYFLLIVLLDSQLWIDLDSHIIVLYLFRKN
jgi:hypothetical protein